MQHKEANALIWGAWAGIAAAIIAFAAQANGELTHGTVWGFGMGGFFWGWVVANVKNWLANRPVR